LAAANRPDNIDDFNKININLTQEICNTLEKTSRKIPVVFTSSTHAGSAESLYGISKLKAENILLNYLKKTNSPIYIYRLSNVFGKWARPNYNSAIATFCYNISRGIPIEVHNRESPLELIYIDDLISSLISLLAFPNKSDPFINVTPTYPTTVGEVIDVLMSF